MEIRSSRKIGMPWMLRRFRGAPKKEDKPTSEILVNTDHEGIKDYKGESYSCDQAMKPCLGKGESSGASRRRNGMLFTGWIQFQDAYLSLLGRKVRVGDGKEH